MGTRRNRTAVRRGAPAPPTRKKKESTGAPRQAPGIGFENFLKTLPHEEFFFSSLLAGAASGGDLVRGGGTALVVTPREGFLLSTIFHLLILFMMLLGPDLLNLAGQADSRLQQETDKPERLVLFMEPPPPPPEAAPSPTAVPPLPPRVSDNRLIIPKAVRPAPRQPEFQNDLPFSEGNTDEFVSDKESKRLGEEGEPGEEQEESLDQNSGDGPDQKTPSLLPRELDFSFFPPDRPLPPQPAPPSSPDLSQGAGGDDGERGDAWTVEEIRRFLRDKRFHNPEGGLITGLGRTLYYNDKGADFVPWLRRMLWEVKHYWLATMPYSAAFSFGHVAVAVSVDRNGDIANLQVMIPSGTTGFDNAAVGALRAADLLPLPPDYPDERFEFILVFWYNEQPYDLF
ncbi:MAG: TonB family protein [Acidobacteriota bacterium]